MDAIGRLTDDELVAPAHPSPARDLLRLERMTARERLYVGHRLGADVPIGYAPLGWGELAYEPDDPIGTYSGQRI